MKNYIPAAIISMALYSSCKHPAPVFDNAQILCRTNYSVYHSGDSISVILLYQPQRRFSFDSIFLLTALDISDDSIWSMTTLSFENRPVDTVKMVFNARSNGKDTIGLTIMPAYWSGTISVSPQCYVVIEP